MRNNVDAVIAWSRAEMHAPSRDWSGMCQSHCRSAYGVPAWSDSALHAWGKIPPHFKHSGGDPADAPRGAILYYSGGKFGHAALAIGHDGKNCLSNDYARRGKIGLAPRTFPRWNLHYLGWSSWTPSGVLHVA